MTLIEASSARAADLTRNWAEWDAAHRVLHGHHWADHDMAHSSREWGERKIDQAVEQARVARADPKAAMEQSLPFGDAAWRVSVGVSTLSKPWEKFARRVFQAADGNTRVRNNLVKEQQARAVVKGLDHVRPDVRAAMEQGIANVEADPRIEQVAHGLGIKVRFEAGVDFTREPGENDKPDPFPAKASAEQYRERDGAFTIHLHDSGMALNLLKPDQAKPPDENHLRGDFGLNEPGSSLTSSGWQGTITHEFGHVVEAALAEHSDPRVAQWRQLWDQYSADYEKGFKDAGEDFNARGATMKDSISYYSTWNEKEGFAETFAAVMSPGYDRGQWGPRAAPLLSFMEDLVSST